MLEGDGVEEGLFCLQKSILLAFLPAKTALFFIRPVRGWRSRAASGKNDLKKFRRPKNLEISSFERGAG